MPTMTKILDRPPPPGELARQATIARALGSRFVAAVLAAGDRQLCRAPRTATLIATWPGDPAEAALAMRFNAALHALARRGASPALVDLYRRRRGDFDAVLGATLAAEDDFICSWMRHPTQTNEVGRAAAIVAALMVLHRDTGLPVELLELGSSAGLNLNLAHYSYDLGGVQAGTAGARVHLAPVWRGRSPPARPIELVAARGVDIAPLDAADAATRERLIAHVFADQPNRVVRLIEALRLARLHPPVVDRADAATWLVAQLAIPQPHGRCRTVVHSMVLQYLTPQDRRTIHAAMAAAGEVATSARPLARIQFEWTAARDEVQLLLTEWPTGVRRHLATCHPYGASLDWIADR